MLKIAFFAPMALPQGTYFRWHNLAIGLQQLGHQVTVHAIDVPRLGRTRREIRDGVEYVLVPGIRGMGRLIDAPLNPIPLLRSLRHAPEPVDVIHIFQPFPHSCLPALFHRDLASVLVYDWDDLWWGGIFPESEKCHWRWALTRGIVRRLEARLPAAADAVTTCSAYLRDAAVAKGVTSVEVIHNGYWPVPPVSCKAAARESLGLDPQAFYFGFMGRTVGEFPWCLDVFAARPPEGRPIRFALCGMPPDSLDSVPAGLRSRIDYLGQLTPAQTRIFACAIDCGLLPLLDNAFNQSRFPIKFAEYLAGGAHVLASAVGEFASIAPHLPGVTLAGTTRDSWRDTLASSDWGRLTAPFSAGSESVLAEKLGWPALARQLQDFYLARLADTANRQPVPRSHGQLRGGRSLRCVRPIC